ncbi:MAG: shufflon system plasmid conjugative transfer pilus tip adhesin PilV [Alphaproteobacteria bacterium]|nr:shufflon system plasmid conjugative transfer pilus tip adhesin PilV [Alphaproteobacteria bacterium]
MMVSVGGVVLSEQSRGNFLLQALLAIALVMAFMPMLAQKLATRKSDLGLSVSAQHINNAARAARVFVRFNKDNIKYGVSSLNGEALSDLLEPFGLPLGFVPQTAQGQKISMIASKNDNGEALVLLVIRGGNLSPQKRRELMARIGPDAADSGKDGILHGIGGWEKNLKDFKIKPDKEAFYVLIPSDDDFSELIRRNANDPERNRFHTDLDMGGYTIKNISSFSAKNAEVDFADFGTLAISGSSTDRRFKNKIELLSVSKAVFQSREGSGALNITRGDLRSKLVSTYSIFKYGLPGSIEAESVSLNSLTMAVGRAGFTGSYDWDVGGDVILNNVSLNTEMMEISGFINASRGQDVFIDQNEISYSARSGIETRTISAAYLTLRDQISSALASGDTGAILLDIRPSGVSVLPDILLDSINNDKIDILKNPEGDDSTTVSCKTIITSLPGMPSYEQKSVAQNIVCQYIFWQRLERRINMKQCIEEGRRNCK